jgi:chaperonin cofactor prefoldin
MDIPVRDTGGSEDTWQNTISRQLKQKPKIDRVDYSKVEIKNDIADTPVEASGDNDFVEMSTTDFLKNLESQEESKKAEKPVKDNNTSAIENEFDVSDLDLSKDEEIVEKPKVKKSKEDNIAELRKKAETYENEAKTKEAKLAEYQTKLEELEATLERTSFEKSPRFKNTYQAPYEEAINKAVEFAKTMADDPSIVEKALSLPESERLEFIDDTFGGGSKSAKFQRLLEDAEFKRSDLESALQDHRTTNEMLDQAEVKSREKTMQKINKNFDRMANHLANKLEFFRKGDDDASNSLVDKRIAAARNIISGNASENEMLAAPFLAVVAKEAVEKLGKLEAELAKYKARVAEDVSVSPRISRSSSDDNETGSSTRKPKGALEAFKSHLRNL